MKRKNWNAVPWTPFVEVAIPSDPRTPAADTPTAMFRNSRYQVALYVREETPPFGVTAHLSIKVHDRQAHHDWRDLQRIKNELCGPELDAGGAGERFL